MVLMAIALFFHLGYIAKGRDSECRTAKCDDMHAKDGSEVSVGSCRLAAQTRALCPRGRRALALSERGARVLR